MGNQLNDYLEKIEELEKKRQKMLQLALWIDEDISEDVNLMIRSIGWTEVEKLINEFLRTSIQKVKGQQVTKEAEAPEENRIVLKGIKFKIDGTYHLYDQKKGHCVCGNTKRRPLDQAVDWSLVDLDGAEVCYQCMVDYKNQNGIDFLADLPEMLVTAFQVEQKSKFHAIQDDKKKTVTFCGERVPPRVSTEMVFMRDEKVCIRCKQQYLKQNRKITTVVKEDEKCI